MADLAQTQSSSSPATDVDGNLLLSSEDAHALLRECFAEFKAGLIALVHVSIETTNDLFEGNAFIGEAEVAEFRSKRGQWVERFGQALTDLFERRLAGTRRQGRRPDFDASLTTLRVLNTFDHEKQAALTSCTQFLYRLTKRELDAIDLRVGALLGEPRMRDVDNPFSPDYVLDAIGLSSRALYPNPRVWRPLMERLLSDVTLGINKSFIKVNRFLADHQVLPEIKAQLRARSELRPRDDAELLPTFLRLFKEGRPAAADQLLALGIAVPAASASTPTALKDLPKAEAPQARAASAPAGGAPQAEPAPTGPYGPPTVSPVPPAIDTAPAAALAAALNPYIADLARALQPSDTASAPSADVSGLPQVDPLMAIGSLSAAVAVLDRWQRVDPGSDYRAAEAATGDAASRAAAMNRIPFIRAAIDDKVVSSTDKITMDVIGLLFDYIFRDPSIPEELRSLFTRLQVPILKTALLDRSFFSDRKHPARRLLDHLAGAAIGATGDAGYRAAFELTAAGVIEEVCRDFQVDVGVFDVADRKVQEFVDAESQKAAGALGTEVAAALAAEEGDADRSAVRALIRDKLSGLDVPFDVRSFSETIWADYLTNVRLAQGAEGEEWRRGVRTLDDLLWSLTAKERTAQKARLAKLVPGMIRNLRAGAAAVNIGDERVKPLLDAMYQLHMAAIKPASADDVPPPAATADAAGGGKAEAVARVQAVAPAPRIANVHDFVAEMVVGTWLAFGQGDKTVNARLSWISPMRSKYLFTTRERSRAIVATPEDLAWQLGAGKATLIVEPVPLFDRAVSAALDTLAAQKPRGDTAAAA
ncbi:MAG TPA: DUF1631 family protein [Casimicrobiaceae bacterium]|nr:DUF1631 family protein [Casimicrobiaceae bacterium]